MCASVKTDGQARRLPRPYRLTAFENGDAELKSPIGAIVDIVTLTDLMKNSMVRR
jgi:hypothetical protein